MRIKDNVEMQNGIEFFREEYKEQKRLEQIVTSRKLYKPKTKKWQVMIFLVVLPFLLSAGIVFVVLIKLTALYKTIIGVCLFLAIIELYVRFCLIEMIKCYQHYAKDDTRRRCIPSCSEYSILALKTLFPLSLALYKIGRRLFRVCDGKEYKEDFPCKRAKEQYGKKI